MRLIIMLFVKRGVVKYIENGRTAISYQLSYCLTSARQCGKVVALQQVFVYKICIATFQIGNPCFMCNIYITIGLKNHNTLLFSFEFFVTKISTNIGTYPIFL